MLAFYLAASLLTFVAYALDKAAAQRGAWRMPEVTLLLLGLLGGWPGAWAAQRLLRHKTRKTSFQIAFWCTVALHCAALGWLMVAGGASLYRS